MGDREHSDVLAMLWGLQGSGIAYVEIREDGGEHVKVVGLEDRRREHVCSCGKRHRDAVGRETEPRRWRDCSLGDFVTYVEIEPCRLACCGGTRVEVFPWEAPGHRMTRRFFERIAALCTKMTVSAVAQASELLWDTVGRADKRAIELALGGKAPPLTGLRFIGVDEVSRTGGHVYFTIVTNLKTGRVVWIGDGKGRKGLLPFLRALGPKGRRKIRGVVSDLARIIPEEQ